jgi:hypothetical protein
MTGMGGNQHHKQEESQSAAGKTRLGREAHRVGTMCKELSVHKQSICSLLIWGLKNYI